MIRMAGSDCVVMCNLINTHTHTHAVSDGVDIMAFTATLDFEEGCTILSYDGANAFNSI